MADWIPVVSQLKSLVQWASGDAEGALETQFNFIKKCPVVAQVTGTVAVTMGHVNGDRGCVEFGEEALRQGTETINGFTDSTPVIGQMKAAYHHLLGQTEEGNRVLECATRATVEMVTSRASGRSVAVSPAARNDAAVGTSNDVVAGYDDDDEMPPDCEPQRRHSRII